MTLEKQRAVAALLKERQADAIIALDEPTIRFFCNIDISDNAAVLTANGCYLIADMRYFEDAKKLKEVTVIKSTGGLFATLKQLCSELFVKTALFNENKLTLSQLDAVSDFLTVKKGAEDISRLRAFKDDDSVSSIKKAAEITDSAFLHVLPMLKENVSELDIVSEIIYFMKKQGAGEAFDTMVLFGEKTSVPHGVPSNNKLKCNMPILFDFGAKYNGYCADMSRSFYFGKSVPEKYRKGWETVFAAQKEALEGISAGKSGRECDLLARNVIDTSEFSGLFTHSLGHGVGCEIHEWPNFAPRCDYPILPRSVLSVEPGIYLEGEFGIRIEDIVLVKDGGILNLTSSEKFMNI